MKILGKKITYPLSNFINFMIEKIAVGVKMLILERTFPNYFIRHFSFEVHEKFQHLVIRFSRKHDFSSVQFVNSTSYGPHINTKIVRYAEN